MILFESRMWELFFSPGPLLEWSRFSRIIPDGRCPECLARRLHPLFSTTVYLPMDLRYRLENLGLTFRFCCVPKPTRGTRPHFRPAHISDPSFELGDCVLEYCLGWCKWHQSKYASGNRDGVRSEGHLLNSSLSRSLARSELSCDQPPKIPMCMIEPHNMANLLKSKLRASLLSPCGSPRAIDQWDGSAFFPQPGVCRRGWSESFRRSKLLLFFKISFLDSLQDPKGSVAGHRL